MNSNITTYNEEAENEKEAFLNSDKVVSVINLLTKHKIKLWELPNLSDPSSLSKTEVNILAICQFAI
jgi:hypothetical protein